MKPRRTLGPGMRLLLRGIHAVNRRTLGYSAPFLDEVVRQYGLRGALTRLTRVQEIAELLEARLGERDAHLLIGFASLWNGCSFCTLGHVHAANLAHFRDTGALLPLAEDELRRRMLADDDAALLAHLRDVLADQHAATLARLERQYQLKTGEVPHPALLPGTAAATTPEDDLLALAITAYDWLNHCSLVGPETDELVALSPLQRDRDLRRRYAAARQAPPPA